MDLSLPLTIFQFSPQINQIKMAKTPSKKAAKATKPAGDKKKRKKARVQVINFFLSSISPFQFIIQTSLYLSLSLYL